MSYADAGCRTRFTEEQIDKMHLAIENSIDLQGALHGELIGDKDFCSYGIYSIEGLANNETANWTVTKYLNGSTITLQTSDCTRNLRIRTSNSCGTSGNFFTIPCEETSYSYNLNLNNSTLSIDVEETEKASLASTLSINESDIKTSGSIQSIQVLNKDGQVIFSENYLVATKKVRIDTSSWSSGEYILEIINGDMTQKRKIRIK